MFTRFIHLLTTVALTFLPHATALASNSWAANLNSEKQVTLQLKWSHQFQFAGYYMAQAKGFYQQKGLNVNIKAAEPGDDPIREVLDNNAEFGVGTSELLLHYDQGQPIKVLGVIFQHSPLALIALETSGIDTVADFVQRKVMIEENSSEIYALLKQSNITEQQLQTTPHQFNIQDLIDNKVDAMTVYTTSEVFELASSNIPYRIFTPRMAGIDFYGDNFFTTQAFYENNEELVEGFRQATIEGWKYAMNNIDETIRHIQKNYPNIKSDAALRFEAEAMQALMRTDLIEPGHMSEKRWQHISSVYHELGLISQNKALQDFFYHDHQTVTRLKNSLSDMILLTSFAGAIILFILLITRHFYHLKVKLKTMVDQSPAAVILLDEQFQVIEWNEQAYNIFGWQFQEVQHKDILNFLVADLHKNKVKETLIEVLDKQKPLHLVNKNHTKNGGDITCSWSNAPFHINNEKFLICMAIDSTELRDLKALSLQKEASDQQSEDSSFNELQSLLVDTMKLNLLIWEESTSKSKVQFATESGLWRVSLDGSTAKTRTLDKYLSIHSIPKNPRSKNVINSANFILRTFPEHPKATELKSLKCQIQDK